MNQYLKLLCAMELSLICIWFKKTQIRTRFSEYEKNKETINNLKLLIDNPTDEKPLDGNLTWVWTIARS